MKIRLAGLAVALALCAIMAIPATANVSTPGDYDANGNCTIERDEVIAAVKDYFSGEVTRDFVISVVVLYFNGDKVCTPEPVVPPGQDLDGDVESTSLSAMVKRVRPSVVMVVALADSYHLTAGSGFIFKVDGETAYILTNHHVVDWAKVVQIVVNDEDTYNGTVVNRDASRDLAVVKICCGTFEALEFGDVSELEVGDDVIAIGYAADSALPRTDPWYPYEYIPPSVTKGIVSAFRYETNTDTRLIQHDASISPGSSGSPLFTPDGKVVGVNQSGILPFLAENIAFAISAITVQEELADLLVQARSHTFGPINGTLVHTDDGLIDIGYARGFEAADLETEVRFVNHSSASLKDWSYGLVLRQALNQPRIYFVVATYQSSPYWRVYSRQSGTWTILDEGVSGNIQTVIDQGNHLTVRLAGTTGTFSLNGIQVASLSNLGGITHAGYVGVAANFFTGHAVAGLSTDYVGFYGVSLD